MIYIVISSNIYIACVSFYCVYAYICGIYVLCAYVHICMHVLIHVVGTGWCWPVFFYCLIQVTWSLPFQPGSCPISPDPLVSTFPSPCCWGVREMHHHFFLCNVCFGELNLGFHACKASSLPTAPALTLNFVLECCKPTSILCLRGCSVGLAESADPYLSYIKFHNATQLLTSL